MPTELLLPFDDDQAPRDPLLARDEASREFAVSPSRNVVLEASAGTGKTRVLVTRYINLLRAGVDPANILAITFTRKAAAEMRERIVAELRGMAGRSASDAARWRELRDRLGEIGISTIDAFCLSLLREFPLEADLDPGFEVADETELPRIADEALDASLRAARRLAGKDEDVALVMAALGERKVRAGLAALLDRRMVTVGAIRRFVGAARSLSPRAAFLHASTRLAGLLDGSAGGVESFVADGPVDHPAFALIASGLRAVAAGAPAEATALDLSALRSAIDGLSAYFLTKDGAPRKRPAPGFLKEQCPSPAAWKRHAQAVAALSPYIAETLESLERDLNRGMARGVDRLFRIARRRYGRALEAQASLDFTEALARTLALLRRMDEFAQSRYRLEARYHHVLVDEFQDTSRAQWRLVASLVESWGEGMGLAHDAPLQPSVFVVGDRKQSIYGFRDADVRMLRRARRYISGLRPDGDVRRTIARSFRSAPALLAFANDVFGAVPHAARRADAFRYSAGDRFPVHLATAAGLSPDALGVAAAGSQAEAAAAVGAEVSRLLAGELVRDRQSGMAREARPGDVAILFRSRESHRDFQAALEARGIPTYVYKGLGFFDADEVKDLVALLRFLADPASPQRAAAFLRSRLVRLSDAALRALAPSLPDVLLDPQSALPVTEEDRRVVATLAGVLPRWLGFVDRMPPAELVDRVLEDCAYAAELGGAREAQARENVKKVRALLRRIQNRGYATLPRIADHLDRLSAGDESNAVIDAADAVNLMTVHAAKGLEFPIVFLVNLGRGTGSHIDPVLVVSDPQRQEPLVSIDGSLPEAEAAVRERDVEETKRLLYVAVTRARERLYLSAVVKDGHLRPGRGSLAEVLPAGVRELMERASADPRAGYLEWRAPGGSAHRFRVCGMTEGDGDRSFPRCGEAPHGSSPSAADHDFAPWCDATSRPRIPVTTFAAAGDVSTSAGSEAAHGAASSRLVGTLVHRLFQSFGADGDAADEASAMQRATRLVRDDELADVDDVEAAMTQAVHAFLGIRLRPDVKAILEGADCLYEVPFSMCDGTDRGRLILRGTIDCLAFQPDGRLVVVEIKTGRPRDWHATQLERYVAAARALFPLRSVDGLVFYA